MASTSWLSFAGTEIANAARTHSYASSAGLGVRCGGCSDLAASLGDEPYTNPVDDRAVWFDPSVPESKDFYGLMIKEIAGADSATGERQWTELLGNGGRGGALRRASREIQVTGWLFGASRAAMSYGKGWLASALRGSNCPVGCRGDTLCLYAACPQRPLDPDSGDPCLNDPGIRPGWDPVLEGNRLQRHLSDVSLISGPEKTAQARLTGGWYDTVEFTLKAANPFWYAMPRPVTHLEGWRGPAHDPESWHYEEIGRYDPLQPAGADCPQPVDCLDTPEACPDGQSPWGDEPFPGSYNDPSGFYRDTCYPTSLFRAGRVIVDVPRGIEPDWSEKVPIIRIYTGGLPLRRLTLRWYSNPLGLSPRKPLDACRACNELTIPWLPSYTELFLDGRTWRASVDCREQGATQTGVTLYGELGKRFSWPVFDCSTGMLLEILAQSSSISRSSVIDVEMASRWDAV